ncbi:MAG: sulfotransferase [Holophagae bacterium]|nr:sulfotransferase [Holophagae bacterium]
MLVSYEGENIRLPDFLIPGAARSGTTALYEHLRKHPDVFMPIEKEPMFLSLWNIGKRKEWQGGTLVDDWTVPNLQDYIGLFRKAKGHQKSGEASVWYLYDYKTVIQNIRKLYGEKFTDLKIVIMLRNPIHRAWSHYLLKCSRMKEPLPFEEVINPDIIRDRLKKGLCYSYDYTGFGRYAEQIRAWQNAFPNIRIWIHEEFFSDISASMKKLADFLEIPMHPSLLVRRRINASGVLRNQFAKKAASLIHTPSLLKSSLKWLVPSNYRRTVKLSAMKRLLARESLPERFEKELSTLYEEEIQAIEMVLNRSLDIWRDQKFKLAVPE